MEQLVKPEVRIEPRDRAPGLAAVERFEARRRELAQRKAVFEKDRDDRERWISEGDAEDRELEAAIAALEDPPRIVLPNPAAVLAYVVMGGPTPVVFAHSAAAYDFARGKTNRGVLLGSFGERFLAAPPIAGDD